MLPKITVVTLVVEDLARSIHFYCDGLGLPKPHLPDGGYAVFDMGPVGLALCPREVLIEELGENIARMMTVSTVSQNVAAREEVDQVISEAIAAGATLVAAAEAVTGGGRRAWFADPDGHLWEIIYNPKLGADSAA
jgi:catechol 2,3-dioxygenase-like lactoylglutathione lyase family enzyme